VVVFIHMRLTSLHESRTEEAAIALLRASIAGTEYEGRVYLAGGYVRDEILGHASSDLDLVVNLPEGGLRFAAFLSTRLGLHPPIVFPRFGTARLTLQGVMHAGVNLSSVDIEAVAPRSEQYPDSGSRNPEIAAGSLEQDVERRDFTVNSLLKNVSTGEILDLTGRGIQDIKDGVLRTPMDPDQIFSDDPLRMLRAVRFAAKYGWQLAPGLLEAIRKNAARLEIISKERVRDELEKMLVSQNPKMAIQLLMDTGLIEYVHPKLAASMRAMVGMGQNSHHHLDVYNHVLEVLSNASPGVVERLSALLHDIAKPQTRTPHESKPGEYRFLGHEDEGAEVAREIMADLKFPGDVIEKVVVAVSTHMGMKDPEGASNAAIRRWARKLGDNLDIALDLMRADALGHDPAHRDPNDPGKAQYLKQRIATIGADQPKAQVQQKVVTGHDLQRIYGLKPGPGFKKYLEFVQGLVDEDPEITQEAACGALESEFGLKR
jgi:poly(A) polymerase